MTAASIAALFGAMAVLAAVPDASAVAVAARSLAGGLAQGLVTVLGILVGDAAFILLAFYSLAAIADSFATLFVVVQYLAAGFLVHMGTRMLLTRPAGLELPNGNEPDWLANFSTGFLITLGDPKALVFYLSFLPAFVDLPQASTMDAFAVLATATAALALVKGGYAYLADRARRLFEDGRARTCIQRSAGALVIATAVFLVFQA